VSEPDVSYIVDLLANGILLPVGNRNMDISVPGFAWSLAVFFFFFSVVRAYGAR